MNADATFERDLARWLEGEAPQAAPPRLHEAAVARARDARQRPSWLVVARGGTFPSSVGTLARPSRRAVYLVTAIALVIVALAGALAAGAFRSEPILPLGGNGSIVASVQGNDRTGSLHRMDADGNGDEPIVAGRCPTFSADGRMLAWADYDGPMYLVVDAEERLSSPSREHDHRLMLVEQPPTSISFAISPDGMWVAWFKPIHAVETFEPDGSSTQYGFDSELWVAPVDGGPGTLVVSATGVPKEFAENPVWSPDGRRIAFERYEADIAAGRSRRVAIDVIDADGTDLRRLTSRPSINAAGLSWSPDGRYLAYAGLPDGIPVPSADVNDPTDRDPALDVFVIGADGSGEQNVSNSSASEAAPAWAPDGQRLGYLVSVADGESQLATLRMDGPNAIGSPARGPLSPWVVWSPDATLLMVLEQRITGPETMVSTLSAVDRDFRAPATTLHAVDGLVLCAPRWQRVDP